MRSRRAGCMRVQVRIRADPGFTKWDVEVAAPAAFSRSSKLAPLFGLIFRRSSCQHPLLAGALGAPQADLAFPDLARHAAPDALACAWCGACNITRGRPAP